MSFRMLQTDDEEGGGFGIFASSEEKREELGYVQIDNSNPEDDEDVPEWVGNINQLQDWAEITAGVFLVVTILLMMTQIGLHLYHGQSDSYRVYTIRILLMVPIYSVTSYVGLHDPPNAVIYALIRDCYECFVLFSFLQYCLTFLGGPVELSRYLIAKQQADLSEAEEAKRLGKKPKRVMTHAKHPFGCWCICPCCPIWEPFKGRFSRPWSLGAEFVRLALLGTLQYIPFSLLVTIASIIGFERGCYHEGKFAFDDVYLYVIIIRNWSQCWALYCLGYFYTILHDELGKMQPLLKFSVIKAVVLFMWWQGVFVNMLEQSPMMKEADDGLIKRGWTSMQVGTSINNFMCIIEMLLIGIAMHYAFHYTEWADPEIREAQKNVGPFGALIATRAAKRVRKGATATTKFVTGDGAHAVYEGVAAAPKYVKKSAKFVVSPNDWQRFGNSMSSGAVFHRHDSKFQKEKLMKRKDDEDEVLKYHAKKIERNSQDLEGKDLKGRKGRRSSSEIFGGNEKVFAIRLPKIMNAEERMAAARLMDGVNFMDLFRVLYEINVLEEHLVDGDDDIKDNDDGEISSDEEVENGELPRMHMFRGRMSSVDSTGDGDIGEDIVDGKFVGGGELNTNKDFAGGYVTDASSNASSAASSVDRNEGKKKGKKKGKSSRKPSVASIDEDKGLMSEEMDRDLESGSVI